MINTKLQPEIAQELMLNEKVKDVLDSIEALKQMLVSLSVANKAESFDSAVFDYNDKRYIISKNSIIIVDK